MSHARIQNRRDSQPVDEWFCGTCFTPWPCPEALDALLAEHVGCEIPREETENVHCDVCETDWPCTIYLLASEVRDARPVVKAVRETSDDHESFFVDLDDEPCRFDHNGFCQSHYWTGSEKNRCGLVEAKERWEKVHEALAHYEEGRVRPGDGGTAMSDDIHFAQVEDEPYVQMAEFNNTAGETRAYLSDDQGEILYQFLKGSCRAIAAQLREVATLTAERDRLRIELENARQHAKGIVQGGSPLEIAEAILGEHEDNRPRGASGERLDSELCRVCALASLIKEGSKERDALRTALEELANPVNPHIRCSNECVSLAREALGGKS